MIAPELQSVLATAGYLQAGRSCAPGVKLGQAAQEGRRGRRFSPDARWQGASSLRVYFKYALDTVTAATVGEWRREIWNEGNSPLLWVVSPQQTILYNAFGRPQQKNDAEANRLETFDNIASEFDRLDSFAGRLAMETGEFWRNEPRVDRTTGVEQLLLADLAALERDLVAEGLGRHEAQGLIGRCVFTQCLIDRGIVDEPLLQRKCGQQSLPLALRDRAATRRLFAWLSKTFNGDMFPGASIEMTPAESYLERVADFLQGTDPASGQRSLFPYQFDVIPVELISSIYEQFAHSDTAPPASGARQMGIHYTRLSVVSLVLDEVMREATGRETVLDPTCGSGVFLVEAFRRLVQLRSDGAEPTREVIRLTLQDQVFGMDISETAIHIAAFSLYLAALEMDPDPTPPDSLRFKPLIDRNLFAGDAHAIAAGNDRRVKLVAPGSDNPRKFEIIVGKPLWSFKGRAGTAARRSRSQGQVARQPRGESLDFLKTAQDFADEKTRFGFILSALPFFSGSKTGLKASHSILQSLAPVTLVNLSSLRSWLFPNAKVPAIALFARHRLRQRNDQVTVVQVPWSESGKRTHTFEIAPRDILRLPASSLQRRPELLKAAAFGRHHDLLLLERLGKQHATLERQLSEQGTRLRLGLIFGNRSHGTDALQGLPLLDRANSRRFALGTDLPLFGSQRAEDPRPRAIYRAPLLLIRRSLVNEPRPVVAVSERDLVFTEDYIGASLASAPPEFAHLLAAMLSSSMAAWHALMTSSEFGLSTNRLFVRDLARFPVPDIGAAIQSPEGRRILEIETDLQRRPASESDWNELDEAVLTLYGLDETERIVVEDGLFRAHWQWQAGRRESMAPAGLNDMASYARAFLGTMDAWFSARNARRMRAEIFALPRDASLRVIRFVLEEHSGPSILKTVPLEGRLADLLKRIGERLNVRITDSSASARELHAHGPNEVVIIKPSARRHWLGVSALEDADAVVVKGISGAAI